MLQLQNQLWDQYDIYLEHYVKQTSSDDYDYEDDDDELFFGIVDWQKGFSLISNQDHCERPSHSNSPTALSRHWICTEPEFSLCWMRLYSSDSQVITGSQKEIQRHQNKPTIVALFLWISFNLEKNGMQHPI